MKIHLLRLLAISVLVLYWFDGYAEYSNPTLKVLLFKTSAPVLVKSTHQLSVKGIDLYKNEDIQIWIKPASSTKINFNNRLLIHSSLVVSSSGTIKLKKQTANASRRYKGNIEFKPYSGGMYIINHIPIESYLEGVLNAEISTDWPIEVVKAQSVISRTYALHKREKRIDAAWHLSSGHFDQVYKGAGISDKRGRYAIQKTRGIVVTYRNKLAQTFYHSNCGGMTEDPGNIWKTRLPYLKIKSVPYGQDDPRYYWKTTISDQAMKRILRKSGISVKNLKEVYISQRTLSKRAFELVIMGDSMRKVAAYDFRKMAGYQKIQSLLFNIIRVPGGYYFEGKGNGHGVGLSQWAAREMAQSGYNYQEILNFFYSGVKLYHYWN